MTKFRSKYEYSRQHGHRYHQWLTVGRRGALHLRITDLGEKSEQRYSGGLEIHYREPPESMADDAPSHDDCWLLKCPCWHDGSSLYVSEVAIPHWLHDPQNIERMIAWLEREYAERFPAPPVDDTARAASAEGV